jgi:hypothetical protein
MTARRYLMPRTTGDRVDLVPLGELARLEGDGSLRLCGPLTPTANDWARWHWSHRRSFRDACLTVLSEQVRHTIGGRFNPPWTQLAHITAVRCSLARVMADTENVHAGLKELIDALLMPQPKRPGIGLLVDDNPRHLLPVEVEDRPLGRWNGLPGPGTWIWVRRASMEPVASHRGMEGRRP